MALKTTVKISKVNNLSDARYCAGMGVEMMGFVLDQGTDNTTDPEKYKAITEWVEGVEFVGEFYTSSAAEINEIIKHYPVDYIQIPDDKLIAQLDAENLILRFNSIDQLANFVIQDKNDQLAYVVLEDDTLTSLTPEHMQVIQQASELYPLLLGCGLNVDNVEKYLSDLKITGISLEGGNEISPGVADLDELADMLELLEVEG